MSVYKWAILVTFPHIFLRMISPRFFRRSSLGFTSSCFLSSGQFIGGPFTVQWTELLSAILDTTFSVNIV